MVRNENNVIAFFDVRWWWWQYKETIILLNHQSAILDFYFCFVFFLLFGFFFFSKREGKRGKFSHPCRTYVQSIKALMNLTPTLMSYSSSHSHTIEGIAPNEFGPVYTDKRLMRTDTGWCIWKGFICFEFRRFYMRWQRDHACVPEHLLEEFFFLSIRCEVFF